MPGRADARLHVWQVLHRFAGVVDVEGQWISWKAGAEDEILLAAMFEVVDGLSVEETSALERQAGARITGPRARRAVSDNTTCWGSANSRRQWSEDRSNFGGRD